MESFDNDSISAQLQAHGLLYTCMDRRILPSKFLTIDIGEMFIVRNAGNIIPHKELTRE